ncbi:ribosomal-processing cysteine protease Prp [Yeguia hominis]|uniref:Ribosomal processing cysteine protease Prp n=1 Tax=Yeguia hominis TaxID=2763662 RepID=A0A926D8B0_9FIRM|nr:ribosomal-processing cysteine protease Prp [Yeguia hominis]MBC8533551.1 ribosomal-processing cysteine protease Prp [Yeguia hominis]
MIRAEFLTAGGALAGFRISGHSDYGEEGSDIVCAAVSSAAYLVANTVTDVLHAEARIEVADGDMLLLLEKKAYASCQILLEGLKLHLQGLEEQYPDDIHVFYLEVSPC